MSERMTESGSVSSTHTHYGRFDVDSICTSSARIFSHEITRPRTAWATTDEPRCCEPWSAPSRALGLSNSSRSGQQSDQLVASPRMAKLGAWARSLCQLQGHIVMARVIEQRVQIIHPSSPEQRTGCRSAVTACCHCPAMPFHTRYAPSAPSHTCAESQNCIQAWLTYPSPPPLLTHAHRPVPLLRSHLRVRSSARMRHLRLAAGLQGLLHRG